MADEPCKPPVYRSPVPTLRIMAGMSFFAVLITLIVVALTPVTVVVRLVDVDGIPVQYAEVWEGDDYVVLPGVTDAEGEVAIRAWFWCSTRVWVVPLDRLQPETFLLPPADKIKEKTSFGSRRFVKVLHERIDAI